MKKSTRILLSGLSGILLTLSFPPMPFYFLSFFSFIPILFLLDKTKKFYFWNTYLTFFIYHVATLWWISSFQEKTDPFLMASGFVLDIFHPLYFMVPIVAWLVIRIRLPRRIALYTFPFIWTAWEWVRSLSELSFPWLSVGYSQIYNTQWVQVGDLFGVYGVSFLIVLFNVAVYDIITSFEKSKFEMNRSKFQIAILLIIIAVPIIYSNIQINRFNHEKLIKANNTINIGMVQPNIDPWDKWSAGTKDQTLTLMEYSDRLISKDTTLDLVIWPETSVLYINSKFNIDHKFNFLQDWVDSSKISLLTGFVDIKIYEESEKPSITKQMHFRGKDVSYDNFNSALLLDSSNYGIYHKSKLTPFGERVPHVEIFTFLTKFIDWGVGISFWGKGTEIRNLNMSDNDIRIAPIICIESIYPSFVREFSYRGASIMTVITNDAWYDHTPGPEQHALISAFRALENKKYLARAANSGVTCFISPTGVILDRADQYKQTDLKMQIPTINENTIYTIYGDWFVYLCVMVSVFFLFYSVFKKK